MENIRTFFTDDLGARDVAKEQDLEAHGILALVSRAYREGLLTEKQALAFIDLLYNKSSLYLTKDLVDYAKNEIMGYAHRGSFLFLKVHALLISSVRWIKDNSCILFKRHPPIRSLFVPLNSFCEPLVKGYLRLPTQP